MLKSSRAFIANNGGLLLLDGLALYFSIQSRDRIATLQLLREYETSYPTGYGKQILTKTVAFLPQAAKDWLQELY